MSVVSLSMCHVHGSSYFSFANISSMLLANLNRAYSAHKNLVYMKPKEKGVQATQNTYTCQPNTKIGERTSN